MEEATKSGREVKEGEARQKMVSNPVLVCGEMGGHCITKVFPSPTKMMKEAPKNRETPNMPDAIPGSLAQFQDPQSSPVRL